MSTVSTEKLVALFGLLTEGEMGELSATTTRMLSEDAVDAAAAPLLRFLNLLARADQIWDISYDYTRIRGMLWMANLGVREASAHHTLCAALAAFGEGYLAYTACEGGFMSNDPPRLAHHARQAHRHFSTASALLADEDDELSELLREDVEGRLPYFEGLALYAELLAALLDGELSEDALAAGITTLDAHLEATEEYDPDLASELRAHRLFLEAHGVVAAEAPPLVADADVILGVCAYVDDDLMKRLNDDILHDDSFGEAELSEWLSMSLQGALRTEALQDIFETALGAENMQATVFQPGDMQLYHRGSSYTVTPTLKFSNLGVVALEFAISLEDADEVELQSIVDLIAPYAPEVLLLSGEHEGLEAPDIRHPFMIFEQLAEIAPEDPLLEEGLVVIRAHAAELCCDLDINRDVSDCLAALEPVVGQIWEEAAAGGRLSALRSALLVHSSGTDYFRTLCDRWLAGFLAGCHARYGLSRFTVSCDTERDWFTTVKFGAIRAPGGPPLTAPELVGLPRFRWMLCPAREAKASIGDWIRADDTLPTNLAAIRSHRTDFLFIRGNQAWFYFPDDPYYLIDYEYTETLRLMMWIRSLLAAFTELAIAYNKRSNSLRQAFLRLGAHPELEEVLSAERRLAEYFKLKADDKLALVQDCLISRYDDHAKLMDAVIRDMDLDRGRALLAARLDKVIATQGFLDRQVAALSAKAREKREIRQERLSAQQRRFLKSITTVGAGLYGTSLIPFTDEWQRYALIATIITPIAALLLRNWLEQRSVKADMLAQDEAFRTKLAQIREDLSRGLEWSP